MKVIIVTTQAEYDALPAAFSEPTTIRILGGSASSPIWVTRYVEAWESSHVEARGSSHVVARESSHVEAWESSHVEARGSSHVVAWESSHVVARESSHVEARGSSHVEARGSSHVVARESSHVEAWESSHVEARGSSHVVAWESSCVVARGSSHVVAWRSSHVEAWESSHVEARESSHVEAWESSYVEAWESSHVVARGSSHVVARGSSHVVAWEQVSVSVQSADAEAVLFGFAVAVVLLAGKVRRRTKASIVVKPRVKRGTAGWLDREGVAIVRSATTIFKRVSKEWKTQEGTANETLWGIGSSLEHPAWNPIQECGPGQFHGCSRPYFCDEFRTMPDDRYIAVRVRLVDLHATDNAIYPHKIAFRNGQVLYECDRFGKEIER